MTDWACKISYLAIALAAVAATLQPFTDPFTIPWWVFIALVLVSLSCSGTGMILARRKWKRVRLELAMEQAFGGNPK